MTQIDVFSFSHPEVEAPIDSSFSTDWTTCFTKWTALTHPSEPLL